MIVIAMRSSTTARVSRNERSAEGSEDPMTASTARAKAMSVAVGIAHPRRASPSPPSRVTVATKTSAGTMTPPIAATTGTTAFAGRAQVADEELALELQPGDEEEDGEQAVARPVADGEVEVAPLDADHGVAHGEVGIRPGGVGEHQGGDGGGEQQRAADRLGAQRVGDACASGQLGRLQDAAVVSASGGVWGGGRRVGPGLSCLLSCGR